MANTILFVLDRHVLFLINILDYITYRFQERIDRASGMNNTHLSDTS